MRVLALFALSVAMAAAVIAVATRSSPTPEPARGPGGGQDTTTELLLLATAAGTLLGTTLAALAVGLIVCRRLRARDERVYARYEIALSGHDETRLEELERAVEVIAGVVREPPARRWRDGQPYWAIELHHGPTDVGLQWTACLVCEPRSAPAIASALTAAYGDIRIGRSYTGPPEPLTSPLRCAATVARFRKHRSSIYALGRDPQPGALRAAPVMELIAQAQSAAAAPSTVRLQLLPAPLSVERLAGWLLERHEHRENQGHLSSSSVRLGSAYRRAELTAAQRTQNRSQFWFELTVAAGDERTCDLVSAAVQAVRGENRLHRRRLTTRPGRTLDRYKCGQPARLPLCWFNLAAPLSLRTLISSEEVARLIELPSARIKSVPVQRSMLPRIPAPPDVRRANDLDEIVLTADDADTAFDEGAIHPQIISQGAS